VDIESIRRYSDSLARYTMNDAELKRIEQAERRDVEFIRLWTLKEAVLKRSGEGIRNDMKHVLDVLKDAKTIINEKKGYIYSVVS
jgi:4'-phosphopantetheinyl transferase